MVHLLQWNENRLASLNWLGYVDRYYSKTSCWRFSGPDSNVMRFPDPLVCQV